MKNEPAFPVAATEYHGMDSGMTLRDYFASKAMGALLGDGSEFTPEWLARDAYDIADAMLKARE